MNRLWAQYLHKFNRIIVNLHFSIDVNLLESYWIGQTSTSGLGVKFDSELTQIFEVKSDSNSDFFRKFRLRIQIRVIFMSPLTSSLGFTFDFRTCIGIKLNSKKKIELSKQFFLHSHIRITQIFLKYFRGKNEKGRNHRENQLIRNCDFSNFSCQRNWEKIPVK